jgi:hypothetical protein
VSSRKARSSAPLRRLSCRWPWGSTAPTSCRQSAAAPFTASEDVGGDVADNFCVCHNGMLWLRCASGGVFTDSMGRHSKRLQLQGGKQVVVRKMACHSGFAYGEQQGQLCEIVTSLYGRMATMTCSGLSQHWRLCFECTPHVSITAWWCMAAVSSCGRASATLRTAYVQE